MNPTRLPTTMTKTNKKLPKLQQTGVTDKNFGFHNRQYSW